MSHERRPAWEPIPSSPAARAGNTITVLRCPDAGSGPLSSVRDKALTASRFTGFSQHKELIRGSGYIQFPPQRPFATPVIVQPPTVSVRFISLDVPVAQGSWAARSCSRVVFCFPADAARPTSPPAAHGLPGCVDWRESRADCGEARSVSRLDFCELVSWPTTTLQSALFAHVARPGAMECQCGGTDGARFPPGISRPPLWLLRPL